MHYCILEGDGNGMNGTENRSNRGQINTALFGITFIHIFLFCFYDGILLVIFTVYSSAYLK